MDRCLTFGISLLVLLGLMGFAGSVNANSPSPAGDKVDVLPLVTIPLQQSPIVIDGKIDSAEWAKAAQTCGFIDVEKKQMAATPTTVRLAYDREYLYAAFDSELPENVKRDFAMTAGITGIIKQGCNQYDADVYSDDYFEILCVPKPGGTWHQLMTNGIDTHYDYTISATGAVALGWNPNWQTASTVDDTGWHCEMKIPLKAFGVGIPSRGEVWGMNFGRGWKALKSGKDVWYFVNNAPRTYPTGSVRFGESTEPIVRLKRWGPVFDTIVDIAGEVTNPDSKPVNIEILLAGDSGEMTQVNQTTIGPGKTLPFEFSGIVQDPRTRCLTLRVKRENGGDVIFCSQVPVKVREDLDIKTQSYPSANLVKISINAGQLRKIPLKELSLTVTLRNGQGKTVLQPVQITPLTGYIQDIELITKSLPPGKYKIECRLQRHGQVIKDQTFDHEIHPLPEWFGNTIGITDKVPKPFTPLRREEQTVYCWGREYRFGTNLFPEQIVTQENEILTAPIDLLIFDEKGQRLKADGLVTSQWTKATDFRIEFERKTQIGSVKVETCQWMECDGLLWTTLRIMPGESTIGKVMIRVPIKKEWAEYINTYDYSLANTGRLKPEGWSSMDTPIWLGNGEAGIQWMTETLASCRLDKNTKPVRVTVGERCNTFELTLIDVPTKLDKPFEVSWGWIVTPVRPSTRGHRGWLTKNADYFPGYRWYYPQPEREFDPRWDQVEFPQLKADSQGSFFVEAFKRPDGKGDALSSASVYIIPNLCSDKVSELQYWADEWSPSQYGRQIEGERYVCSTGSRSWSDYLVWHYRKTYDKARYIGMYFDCEMYQSDDNHYHGAGYRKPDGTVGPTYTILAARELTKRMYCMLRELEPEQTMTMYHHSGRINMAVLSWCDVYADGENFTAQLSPKVQDYHRIFPPDKFLAQSMGHNFGLTTWFLDEFVRSRAVAKEDWNRLGVQSTTHLYGLILLHDGGYWKHYGNPEAYKIVDQALMKYHFDERYRMIPYWKQKIVALPENVYATFYVDDQTQTVLMILLNNNEKDLNLNLTIDWKRLGFDDWRKVEVDEPLFKGKPEVADGKLRIYVGKANMGFFALMPRAVK